MRVRPIVALVCGSLVLGLSACTDITKTSAPPPPTPLAVRVMQFNIEYGGTVVDFDSVPKAIQAAGADVVALQEAYGNTCKVADAVQWSYCDPRTQGISRYPLVTPTDPESPAVLVRPEQAGAFGVINLHLPSAPYGPNRALQGADADELVAKEAGRLEAVAPVLDAADDLQQDGVPVVILGDFNSPSHRDWTTQTAGLREQVIPVEWPVTKEVEEAGYVDAYRSVYPDPVSDPGLTWPAARPRAGSYNPGLTGRPADRIDMTFVSPDIAVEDAQIVGESSSDMTDIPITPWPTDHRGVVTAMDVPLGDPGAYISASPSVVDQGSNVVLYANAGYPYDVQIDTGRGDVLPVPIEQGRAVVDTSVLAVGENTLELVADGQPVLTGSLWVREPGAGVTLTTSRRAYGVGEPIKATWSGAPGNKWDWLGVYPRGAKSTKGAYQNWAYTGASVAGSLWIDGSSFGGTWPIPPGEYDLLLLADDSYAELARTPFTVTGRR